MCDRFSFMRLHGTWALDLVPLPLTTMPMAQQILAAGEHEQVWRTAWYALSFHWGQQTQILLPIWSSSILRSSQVYS